MVNSLGIDLLNKLVVIGKPYYIKYFVVLCESGVGLDVNSADDDWINGVTTVDDKRIRFFAPQILRLANPTEIAAKSWDIEVKHSLKGNLLCNNCGRRPCLCGFYNYKTTFSKTFYVNEKNKEFMLNKIMLSIKHNKKIKFWEINDVIYQVNGLFFNTLGM